MNGGDKCGDKAGEHLEIARGRYEAWFHVVCGFLIVAGAVWLVLFFSAGATVEFGMRSTFPDRHERDRIVMGIAAISGVIGLLSAAWIFHDRWRCIEARASRYCSGLMNLSLVYVPVFAAGYALVRGARKFSGR